jgi:hypothetical protein
MVPGGPPFTRWEGNPQGTNLQAGPGSTGLIRIRDVGLLLLVLLLLGGGLGVSVVQSEEPGLKRRKLTIGGVLMDALVDFHDIGGEVEEILPSHLVGKGPKIVGKQNGRSMFAVGSGLPREVGGIVTADGGSVKASMTSDGFLQLQPAMAGFRTRNAEIFKALYPDKPVPAYTEEVIFEYIDESGARLLIGGAEIGKTTSYLLKKDPTTGEIIFRLRRDIINEKASGKRLDPDVSSTFPTRVKLCGPRRTNCETRTIIRKPGDEIRIDPRTRRMSIVFNKDNLPFRRKHRTAQRLSWACESGGRGFFITYREGSLGGFRRPGRSDIGTLSCRDGVLRCERTAPGQKCNFDFRDYITSRVEASLFWLDWLLSRKDPHTHYFTLAPDPLVKRHIRIGNLHNLESIQEVNPKVWAIDHPGDVSGAAGDGGETAWVADWLQRALCGASAAGCGGAPDFKVLEINAVNDGLVLIDERTGTKLKHVERVRLYSLRQPYGWGKRGDFIAALITNSRGAAAVAALTHLNEELQAPDLLEEDVDRAHFDPFQTMLEGLQEEEKWETHRVQLPERTQALVIFPTTHIEDMKGSLGFPVGSPPPVPAKIHPLAPPARATFRPEQP